MKGRIKFFGIIAMIVIVGFFMLACGGSGSPASNPLPHPVGSCGCICPECIEHAQHPEYNCAGFCTDDDCSDLNCQC